MRFSDEEIIDRLRRGYDAFNRGDYDAATELMHPEVVFVRPGGQGLLRGADNVRVWMEPDAFESQTTELGEIEISDQKVLVRQRTTARGAASGLEMEIDSWCVWSFNEDGKVTRAEIFLHHEEERARRALEA